MSLEKREYKFGTIVTELFIFIDSDGEPWFKAKEIANILQYKNTRKVINDHVDDEDKVEWQMLLNKVGISRDSLEQLQLPPNWQPHTVLINESGLYQLMLSSKKTEARQFRRWVTSKVLPSLRKTGKYEMSQTISTLELELEKKNREIQKIQENAARQIQEHILDKRTFETDVERARKQIEPFVQRQFVKQQNKPLQDMLVLMAKDSNDLVHEQSDGGWNKSILKRKREYFDGDRNECPTQKKCRVIAIRGQQRYIASRQKTLMTRYPRAVEILRRHVGNAINGLNVAVLDTFILMSNVNLQEIKKQILRTGGVHCELNFDLIVENLRRCCCASNGQFNNFWRIINMNHFIWRGIKRPNNDDSKNENSVIQLKK